MARHHLSDEHLLAYAGGALAEPLAVLAASHLTLCQRCRSEVARLEALGGLLLEEQPPEPLRAGGLDALLARLDEPEPAPIVPPLVSGSSDPRVPRPLRNYMGGELEDLNWATFRGMRASRLLTHNANHKTFLLWIDAGIALPTHGHEGNESTLVLTGNFEDESGTYARGDVAQVGPETNHRPIAGRDEACICLVVYAGALRLTGPLGRWLNPILRL